MNVGTASTLVVLVLLFPLIGAALNGFLGPVFGRRFVNIVGTASIFASFVVSCLVLASVVGAPAGHAAITVRLWDWINLGGGTNLSVGMDFTLDALSALMLMVITGVGFLIHVYSVGYMEHDTGFARFFSYMNFFIFSMLTLVLAADLVILIIGWALVALSSYLLIGFWHDRPTAVAAARKAFITQVIGDVALVIAAFLIVLNTHTLSLPNIFARTQAFPAGGALVTGVCVLLAIGAFAKSAQFPLHTWLPDAMEGPTPVSALIHAATMVTAGVYLIARFHVLFNLAPVAEGLVACVGMGTAVMAGIIALSQIDIKRVIAYSTMSQIGLMIYAVGIGAYSAGLFHFAMHAVFKALLFMAAGNVIHALHDEQDIRLMGGLSLAHEMDAPRIRCGVTRARWFLPVLGLVQQGGSAGLRHAFRTGAGAMAALRGGRRRQRAHRPLRLPSLLHGLPGRAADGAGIRRQGGRLHDVDPGGDPRCARRSSSRGRCSSRSPTPSTCSATSSAPSSRARNRRCYTTPHSAWRSLV